MPRGPNAPLHLVAPDDQGCQYGLGVLSWRRCRLIWTGRRPGTMWGAGLVGVLGSVLALGVPTSHSDNPTVWLADPRCVSLRECGAIGDGETDDTAAFVQCQQAAKAAGGCISVPSGTYACLAVPINTSHHQCQGHFCSAAKYVQNQLDVLDWCGRGRTARAADANLSILGPIDASFTVDISKPTMAPWNVRYMGDVSDFTLANVLIKMADPRLDPSISIVASKSGIEFVNHNTLNPRRGLVANITSTGGAFGYGMIQTQSVQDTRFENLNGQGGSTLRLETGVGLPGAFVGNITARNVTCRDGWNAAYILPHQQVNGRLTLENFKSFGCLTTVDIGGGYLDPNRHPGSHPGSYSNDSTLDGVLAVYGEHAQAGNLSGVPSCTLCHKGWATGGQWGSYTGVNFKVAITNVATQGFPPPSNRTACANWSRWINHTENFCPYWRRERGH
eukprot:m.329757 g.329757  ORF g.329757 m.329757 type:complete len:447 (-) comp16511_c1_seq11:798-2138(-)